MYASRPHKGFSLRRTVSTSKAKTCGESRHRREKKGHFHLFFVFLRAKVLNRLLRTGLTVTQLFQHGVDHAIV